MFRTSLGVGDAEAPAVLQRRHRPARGLDLRRIDLRQENAGLYAALGEHLAPGRNDQRVAIGLALVLMHATLGCGEHEAAVLDGAGAQQGVPMRLAGLSGKGGGLGEERGAAFGERAIQRRKPYVVADRQPDPAPGQVGYHGGFAGLIGGGFTGALAMWAL